MEAKPPFAKLVEFIEVNVREQLGCEIPYGKTAARRGVEKALRIGKSSPIRKATLDTAALGRIHKHYLVQKKQDGINVKGL